MTQHEVNPEGLWQLLAREHDQLDQLFEQLLEALRADAREDARRLWAEFDERLNAHMEFEEREVLPALHAAWPGEAAALAAEHEQIRAKLGELGVALDRHEIRAELVAEFVEQLRRHARRESALAYQWAERHLEAHDRAALAHRVGAARYVRQRLCEIRDRSNPQRGASR